MKSKLIKTITTLAILTVLVYSPPVNTFNDVSSDVTFNLRIEGVSEVFFDNSVSIPCYDSISLQEAIIYVDNANDSITILGASGASPYITDINGDYAGMLGGWDGWLYSVNNTEPMYGIDKIIINNGDTVCFYFADPFSE